MRKRLLIFILVLIACLSQTLAQSHIQNLNNEWSFCSAGSEAWKPATVPGCIHTDLLKNGMIPDPLKANNEQEVEWVEQSDWTYRTFFSPDAKLMTYQNIYLFFEGVDTYADIYLNGVKLQHCDNMFRSWTIPCKSLLHYGENSLEVHFFSATRMAKTLYQKLATSLPYDERVMVRKAPYQFGWDWGPKQVTMGIWKNVSIVGWNTLQMQNVAFKQLHLDSASADLQFNTQLNSTYEGKLSLELWNDGTLVNSKEFAVSKGQSLLSLPYHLEKPERWWPNGMGNPHLYNFEIKCRIGSKVIDSVALRTGLRTIELVQTNDDAGQSFLFRVNGIPLFIKGSNIIPPDIFPSRISDQNYAVLVNTAKQSNMNMLRIWGGGFYLHDKFFDLCDESGIMIWQDFMFACAMYPGDSGFLSNVKEEVSQQIIRLRNHASLALWCGNNEIDEGWNNWGMQKQFGYSATDSVRIANDYQQLFLKLIPEVLHTLDPERPYHPSSPLNGWGRKESMTHGDSHYWGIWWGDEAFEVYNKKVPRFMSEYGFQGFPDSVTIEAFGISGDSIWNSPALKNHEKHPRGFELISHAMQRNYKEPTDFWEYARLSQTLQADAMRIAIEAQRRAKPYCMGTLYWQLNDCWPVISWSTSDYYGRWKPAQYLVKQLYQPCILSFVQKNDSLALYGISDSLSSIDATLNILVSSNLGKILWSQSTQIRLPASSSMVLTTLSLKKLQSSYDSTSTFIYASISNSEKIIASNKYFFCRPGNYKQPLARIYIKENPMIGNRRNFILSTDIPVFNLWIDCNKDELLFNENYLDLMPWANRSIFSTSITSPSAALNLHYLNQPR